MKIRRFLFCAVALMLSVIFGICGCTSNDASNNSSSNNSSSNNSSSNNSSSNNSSQPSSQTPIVKLDGMIINDGKSDYKVVVSANVTETENYAAHELVSFLYNSTGVVLPIVSDAEITADFSGKYISVGNTSLLKLSGITLDRETYTYDGYRIVTNKNTIILKGQTDYGTLYSVYGFLTHTIGYHAYSPDELYYEKKTEIPLMAFDVKDIPDIEGRTSGFYLVGERTQAKDAAHMKMYAGWQMGYTIFDGRVWATGVHSARILIPKEKYPEHWAASEGAQACVTTEGAYNVWLENLKQVIADNPKSTNFNIGLEDTTAHCTCNTCQAESQAHGGYGGVMIRFLNKLSDDIRAWLQEVSPERDVNLIGLAYYAWDTPPVKEVNGEIVPVDDTVVARDNVGVMYCPIEACFGCAINDPTCNTNIKHAVKLRGWGVITKQISIYSYPDVYFNYFINFNDWGSRQANMQFYKECNVNYFYDQGCGSTYNPMQALRVYLTSQLCWKVDQNVDDLIDDFMAHYYKVAAPYVRKYYDLTRAHYAKLKEEGIWLSIGIGALDDNASAKCWPYAYCTQALQCFEDARKAINDSNLDAETKKKLLIRVDRDSTAVRYLILETYPDYYTKDDFNAMVDEFVEICKLGGVNFKDEWDTPISELAAGWRKL